MNQSLLENHERVGSEVKAYSSEIERLKDISRKVIEGTSSSSTGFVSTIITADRGRLYIIQTFYFKHERAMADSFAVVSSTHISKPLKMFGHTFKSITCVHTYIAASINLVRQSEI